MKKISLVAIAALGVTISCFNVGCSNEASSETGDGGADGSGGSTANGNTTTSGGGKCPDIGKDCPATGAHCGVGDDMLVCVCGVWLGMADKDLECDDGSGTTGSGTTGSGSGTTGSGSTGSGTPNDGAMRTLEVHCPGVPAGSYAALRIAQGSPVVKGDHSPDETAVFLPWPQYPGDPDTWHSFGDDVKNATTEYVEVVTFQAEAALRFQCYDTNGSTTEWGCTANSANNSYKVYENGVQKTVVIVDNLNGGQNCQVDD